MVTSLALGALVFGALTSFRLNRKAINLRELSPPVGQFVRVDNGRSVHMVVRGSGPDVVILHGANGNLRDFLRQIVKPLSQKYRVIAMDRPGLGYSQSIENGASIDAQAAHLRAALAELGVKNPILVGHSYGASVALAWALQEPPAAMVLVSGVSMPWPGKLDWWYRINETAVGRSIFPLLASVYAPKSIVRSFMAGAFTPAPLPESYADQISLALTMQSSSMRNNLEQVNALLPQVTAMKEKYPTLSMPIELIHGDADRVVPLAVHSQQSVLLFPDARLKVLPGAGHMPHHTHIPEIFAAIDRAAERAGLR